MAAAAATRPVAARTAVAATPDDDDDDGAPLLGFILVGLGASVLAGGAVWIMRAPSAAPEAGVPGHVRPGGDPAGSAAARGLPAQAQAEAAGEVGHGGGSSPTRGGGAVKDQPALQQRIAEMRKSGMTLQAIADTLNAEGVPTVRGGARWRPSSVQTASGYKRPGTGSKQPSRPTRSASAR